MKKHVAVASLTLIGLALLAISTAQYKPVLIYNPSQSAEPGWYKISPQISYERGDLVAASLPKWADQFAAKRGYLAPGIPILKTIRAVEGDRYCISKTALLIENAPPIKILSSDSKMRALPVLSGGCRSVETGHVLLISTRVSSSFDSRYFGEISLQAIIGKAEFIGRIGSWGGSEKQEEGGARGSGAQGKIKGLCTKVVLQPCLHIDFHCTNNWSDAPSARQILNSYTSMRVHQFPIVPDYSPYKQNDGNL